jgi:hypothetical protein
VRSLAIVTSPLMRNSELVVTVAAFTRTRLAVRPCELWLVTA